MTPSLDDYIRAAQAAFRAPRGTKMIHAGGRAMRVRTAGELVLHLPNGATVKVSTDDSGVATQVEEDDRLHAIVRPHTIRRKITLEQAAPIIAAKTSPSPIRTTATVRR